MKTQHKLSKNAAEFDLMQQHLAVVTPLSDDVVASLRFMIEEEKLAGDLYEVFYDQTGLTVFDKIANSEDLHMNALVKQAESYGIDVSDLLALPAGEYSDPSLQDLYSALLTAGSLSAEDALNVGVAIEQADMMDLAEAINLVAGTKLVGVYSHLMDGSASHLAAFDASLSM